MTSTPLWLIHGWAANHHVFDPLAQILSQDYTILQPDLPGHGAAPYQPPFDIHAITEQWAAQIDEPSHILGWSLGGQIALHLAAYYPNKVKSLILTASFAKFQASPDYPEGLTNPALNRMVTLFQADYAKYIQQFFELQFLYVKEARTTLDAIMPKLIASAAPPALADALDALAQIDARPLLPQIQCPTLLIFGDKDTITPPRMGQYLHQHIPQSEYHLITQAGHAPFLSHPQAFLQYLIPFLEQAQ